MRKLILLHFFFLSFFLVASPTHTLAGSSLESETYAQCGEILKVCFNRQGIERSNCFYSSATHPFCDGSELGNLTYKRWAMSPVELDGLEAPPAFLGPKNIDESCITKFDTRWNTTMKNKEMTDDTIRQLSSLLEECKKNLSLELQRP